MDQISGPHILRTIFVPTVNNRLCRAAHCASGSEGAHWLRTNRRDGVDFILADREAVSSCQRALFTTTATRTATAHGMIRSSQEHTHPIDDRRPLANETLLELRSAQPVSLSIAVRVGVPARKGHLCTLAAARHKRNQAVPTSPRTSRPIDAFTGKPMDKDGAKLIAGS